MKVQKWYEHCEENKIDLLLMDVSAGLYLVIPSLVGKGHPSQGDRAKCYIKEDTFSGEGRYNFYYEPKEGEIT
jgi:hypothetical protein